MAERNHYEVLGVGRNATQDEIHAQYLHKLLQVHPDHNLATDEDAHERTIEVVQAYQVLSDPDERRLYDFRNQNPFVFEALSPGQRLVLKKERKEAEALFGEGVRALRADLPSRAVESFKASLKLEPAYGAASYNLALLGALLGNTNFALDVIQKGLKLDPQDAALIRLRKSVQNTFLSV